VLQCSGFLESLDALLAILQTLVRLAIYLARATRTYPFGQEKARQDGIDACLGALSCGDALHEVQPSSLCHGVGHATAALCSTLKMSDALPQADGERTAIEDDMRYTPPSGFWLKMGPATCMSWRWHMTLHAQHCIVR
jgi:hypothetical protein